MQRRLRKWLAAGLVLVSGAGLSLYVGHGPVHGRVPLNSDALTAQAEIPLWPWMPHGVAWIHPEFQSVPYPVHQVADPSLPKGQTLLVHPGRQGLKLVMGRWQADILPVQPATVANGTATVYSVTIKGVTYHYDRVLTAMTTAYNGSFSMNGPWGSVSAWDGKPLHYGDVAVDPHVIPLGTYLYIEGYGLARAVDTGSAIWGDHIDLFYPESAWKVALYGIQYHKVYVLTGSPASAHQPS